MSSAHAVEKKPKPIPTWRSMPRTTSSTTVPTPHDTYRVRHGNVALGGPNQTESTR